MAIVGHIDWNAAKQRGETKDAPLWWHTAGRSYTASGYGRKIPSSRMIRVDGRWRRVYVCQYSNAGTAYILKGRDWVVVR